ncbi:MAG: hypothetical protein AB1442_07685 [Nitrospirota bacterium]
MVKLKYLISSLSVANIALMAFVFIFLASFITPRFTMRMTNPLPRPGKVYVPAEDVRPSERNVPSLADFVAVAEDNLFHPERIIPPDKKKEEQPLPKPEFVLYGTLVTDTVSLAYLEDQKAPRNTPGRGKRQTALKKGDSMSGFLLKEIETDKVVMVRGEEKMTVYVRDPQKKKSRVAETGQKLYPHQEPAKPASPPPRLPAPKQPERIETKILPPQNAEEQSIINLFEKDRQNR